MNKKAQLTRTPDWTLLFAVLALVAIGLMAVYSATYDMGYWNENDTAYYAKRQAVLTIAGLVAMLLAARVPYRYWTKLSVPFMLGAVALLIVAAVTRNRQLWGTSLSPVEIAKLAVVVYIGHWLASKRELLRKLPYGLLPFTIMVGIVAGLVVVQRDLSEALHIVLVAVAMFFVAGADLAQFAIGLAGGAAAFGLVIARSSDAMERLRPFLEEWQDPLYSSHDQLVQALHALGSGGLLGLGPGSGRAKFSWLSAGHTDMIFGVVGEELGLIGCLALIVLFGVVAWRGFKIAREAPNGFGRLLAVGVTCMIVFQATINIAVVTGTIPFTGIALPFISVGGTSMFMCLLGVGIMLSVSREPCPEEEATTESTMWRPVPRGSEVPPTASTWSAEQGAR